MEETNPIITDIEAFNKNNTETVVADEIFIDNNNNTWKDGLCGCFNNIFPSMFCVIFTPTIYLSQMSQKITNKKNLCCSNVLIFILGNSSSILIYQYSKFCSLTILYLINIYFLILAAKIRTQVRENLNIPGSVCEDTLLTVCLPPFSIAQTGRTLYDYKKICEAQTTLSSG